MKVEVEKMKIIIERDKKIHLLKENNNLKSKKIDKISFKSSS